MDDWLITLIQFKTPNWIGFKAVIQSRFLNSWQPAGLDSVQDQPADLIFGETQVIYQHLVLHCQGIAKHLGIIGIDRDQQPTLEIFPDRVLGDRGNHTRTQV